MNGTRDHQDSRDGGEIVDDELELALTLSSTYGPTSPTTTTNGSSPDSLSPTEAAAAPRSVPGTYPPPSSVQMQTVFPEPPTVNPLQLSPNSLPLTEAAVEPRSVPRTYCPSSLQVQKVFFELSTVNPLQLSADHPLTLRFSQEEELVASDSPAPVPVSGAVTTGFAPSRAGRVRRNATQPLREGQSEIVEPPYPWATTKRATVLSLKTLQEREIYTITGDVQCKRCERQFKTGYDLKEKFNEIARYISKNKRSMHDRAPSAWKNPVLPKCRYCGQENSCKPVISDKKKSINWLFLLLGQMLGCCTLEQLKYFCKHTRNHRTGAKDRVLYLTYLGLCKQLQPDGPFDRN